MNKFTGYVERGGISDAVTNLNGTRTDVQNVYPLANVTVYDEGTLDLASIFEDSGGVTPKANPFAADIYGYFEFYGGSTTYDIKFSGGDIATPWTQTQYANQVTNAITKSGGTQPLTADLDLSTFNVTSLNSMPVVNPLAYGADPTGATDSTPAFTSALAEAHSSNRPLIIPPGTFDVTGSGSEIFKITEPIHVIGFGYKSQIRINSAVPNTRDLLLYEPATVLDTQGLRMSHFRIIRQTTSSGRYGIHLKPATEVVKGFIIEGIIAGSQHPFTVYMDGTNVVNSIFNGMIRDCYIGGNGIGGVDVVDSIHIDNNTLAGTGYAIDITYLAGGNSTITRNSLTATSGVRLRGNMAGLKILNNYFEVIGTYDGAGDAMLDLNGDTGTFTDPLIDGNRFTVISGTGPTHGARLRKCTKANITNNSWNPQNASQAALLVEATATNFIIDHSNRFAGAGKSIIQGVGGAEQIGKLIGTMTAMYTGTSNVTAGGTLYVTPNIQSGSELTASLMAPVSGYVRRLRVRAAGDPGSGETITVTVRVAGGDTALTVTINGDGVSGSHSVSDLSNFVAITSGQILSVKTVGSNNGGFVTTRVNFDFQIVETP